MNIIHYTLGLYPYRSGGLTKYATDLMLAQVQMGHCVSLLYPGGCSLFASEPIIKKKEPYNGIGVYEVLNPVVVPLFYGLKRPSYIIECKKIDEENIHMYINKLKPDVLHIHTWMGFPEELLLYFKSKGVKVIYTSHDYFGLCLKVNFINSRNELCVHPSNRNCSLCNAKSPSKLFLRFRNSTILASIKRFIPKKVGQKVDTNRKELRDIATCANVHQILLDYYKRLFSRVDLFHFNSELAKSIYNKFIPVSNSKVISVTHNNILDRRKLKRFSSKEIRFGFIGSKDTYKGFPLLKKVLLEMEAESRLNWTIQAFVGLKGEEDADSVRIHYRGKYESSELDSIFENLDLLIVPSLCFETFGLVVLEALSYGVPVLASSTVGAKDIIKKIEPSFVFNNEIELKRILVSILNDLSLLEMYNASILNCNLDFTMEKHCQDILRLYIS